MNSCICCGACIPKGQRTCSMCYGDIDHGNDGYYRKMMRKEAEKEVRKRAEEEKILENQRRRR